MMMQSLSDTVICFDLDDTLYKEKEYVKSAFLDIAGHVAALRHITSEDIYDVLWMAFSSGRPAFQAVNDRFGIDIPISEYLDMYRGHRPLISLDAATDTALSELKNLGCRLGLITDGRRITQRNKIEALGLSRFMDTSNIVVSEEFGSEKPSERNYLYFSGKYPAARYVYVGDNPKKDFLAPNRLGWKTICLLDNGENIHHQDFSLPVEYLPFYRIRTFDEILDIIIS